MESEKIYLNNEVNNMAEYNELTLDQIFPQTIE